jgi:hypothetical protein
MKLASRICKDCEEVKIRVQDEQYPNGKDKRWVDASGCLWNGKMCPDCNKERVRKAMMKMRRAKFLT